MNSLTEIFNIEKSNLEATNTQPHDPCSMNIFALHPEVVHLLHDEFLRFKEINNQDRKIEFLIPNELSNLVKSQKIKLKIHPPTQDRWFGITNPEDEEIVRELLKIEHEKTRKL